MKLTLKHILIIFAVAVISAALTPYGKAFEIICVASGALLVGIMLVGFVKYLTK